MITLQDSLRKSKAGAFRLSPEEGLNLLRNADTAELMAMADRVRKSINGNHVHFVHSLNINPTNVCENKCGLCAFWRKEEAEDAYFISIEEARESLRSAAEWGLTDIHVVGGLTRKLKLSYYEKLFRVAKEILPTTIIQGLTAVEIHWLGQLENISTRDVLIRLKKAGLNAIPGGGAEIFDDHIREIICPDKISGDQWLGIHEQAHELGLPTNATMLFGHIEQPEDIIDHLSKLRDLQDRSHGFMAICPIPFHASGTKIGVASGPKGHTITRIVAMCRIFLDNFPHIRVLANFLDRKLLQTLLYSGADDIGGTSINEQIARAAGAPDNLSFCSPEEMGEFVDSLGFKPVLGSSIYESEKEIKTPLTSVKTQPGIEQIITQVEQGKRLDSKEAVALYENVPFQTLGRLANRRRHEKVPGKSCTFIIDRNISFTNVCNVKCKFCAFHNTAGYVNSFTMPMEEIVRRVVEAAERGATQIMLQGGLNPELDLSWYENMLSQIKNTVGDIWLHSLSPAEILWLSKRSNLTIQQTLERLRNAGLDSLPGGGAEILVDDIRKRVSPAKLTSGQWLEVMETAQNLGMGTTATMVYGLGETTAQRIEHLMKIRQLQDRTGGFRAFIPWSFQSNNTKLDMAAQTGVDYLRILAISRLVLDNIDHIQAGWVTEGPDMVQLALSFGADDFGGVLMEESVVKATGIDFGMTVERIISLIGETGLTPAQRNTEYTILKQFNHKEHSVQSGVV